jgi:hypothetical protein
LLLLLLLFLHLLLLLLLILLLLLPPVPVLSLSPHGLSVHIPGGATMEGHGLTAQLAIELPVSLSIGTANTGGARHCRCHCKIGRLCVLLLLLLLLLHDHHLPKQVLARLGQSSFGVVALRIMEV